MVYFLLQYPLLVSKILCSLTLVVVLFQFIRCMLYCLIQSVHIPLLPHFPLLWLNHPRYHFNHHPFGFSLFMIFEIKQRFIKSLLARASVLSITYWVIVIGVTLQRYIIFTVNKFITSNPPCIVSNYHRYMAPSVLGILLSVVLVSCIACP